MGNQRNRRTEMEINEGLRLETLRCILEARSMEYMAEKFQVTEKAIKFRLTNLYKYYNVKSKYELMALFVQLPEELNVVEEAEELGLVEKEAIEESIELEGMLPSGSKDSNSVNIWK